MRFPLLHITIPRHLVPPGIPVWLYAVAVWAKVADDAPVVVVKVSDLVATP